MKVELIIGFILVIFLTGCNANINEVSDSPENELITNNEDETERLDTKQEKEEEVIETEDTNTMKFCKSTKQKDLVIYEYYWTKDKYYEKVTTSNGGETIKVVTPNNSCVMLKGSSIEGWDCSNSSEALFQETKGVVTDLINSPVNMYGLVCEDVPYDESIFNVEE